MSALSWLSKEKIKEEKVPWKDKCSKNPEIYSHTSTPSATEQTQLPIWLLAAQEVVCIPLVGVCNLRNSRVWS